MVIRVHFVHFKPFVWDFGFDLVGLAKHGLKQRWRAKWNEKRIQHVYQITLGLVAVKWNKRFIVH